MAASKYEDNQQLHKLISKNMLQLPKCAQTLMKIDFNGENNQSQECKYGW